MTDPAPPGVTGSATDLGPRARLGIALLPGQIGYQLRLLRRTPMALFVSAVIPLMLLIALDLVTPEMTLESLGGIKIAQFLTPAMASFAVLNAGFVNVVIAMTLSREEGILKRQRATPLPTWVSFAGRIAAAAIVAILSAAVVLVVGTVFLHATISTGAVPGLAGTFALGVACSSAVGMAASSLVPSAEAALPLSYAVLLPVAFISQVFFPAPTETAWLHHLADVLPVAPFANAMESSFATPAHGLTTHQTGVLAAWAAGAFVFALVTYRWQPQRHALLARHRHRTRAVRHVAPVTTSHGATHSLGSREQGSSHVGG